MTLGKSIKAGDTTAYEEFEPVRKMGEGGE